MILYRYIIREHISPFLSSLSIIVFLFVMQQAVVLLDRIVSKGLDPAVVLEIFIIQLAWIITLAIPMAILIATLTTFGRMAGDNEITSIKASGQSLWPLLTPIFAAGAVLTVLLIYFNDQILPEANHHTANLLSDISRKRPAALIEPKVLISDYPGYTIYTESVDNKTGVMRNIRIFSDAAGQDQSVTVARSGSLRMTPDQQFLELTLFDGETHSVSRKNRSEYFLGTFAKQVIAIKNIDSRFQRTNSNYRGDREKNVATMLTDVKELKQSNAQLQIEYGAIIDSLAAQIQQLDTMRCGVDSATDTMQAHDSLTFATWLQRVDSTRTQAPAALRSVRDAVDRLLRRFKANDALISMYMVEVHKKYSIPLACLIFILIGAPLGIMARRGGMAVGSSYSLLFFVIYWASLIGGEALADKMIIPPWVAMWSGNIFIGLCGIVLTILMLRETTIRFDALFGWLKIFSFGKGPFFKKITNSFIFQVPRILLWAPRWLLRKFFGTLPIYLIGIFLSYVVGLLVALIVFYVVVDYVGNLKRFEGAPLKNIALYYGYYLPWIIQITSPIVLLLASMFSVGRLAKNSELIAMKSAGINIRQLTMPLLFLGVVLSVASFYAGEWVLPRANMAKRDLGQNMTVVQKKDTVAVKGTREFRRNFYYFGNQNTIYVFGEFSTAPQQARAVRRERFGKNSMVQRIEAAEMVYDSSRWYLINGTVRNFGDSVTTMTHFDTLADTILTATPLGMVARIKSIEEMSYWELKGFIAAASRRGEKVSRYMGELDFKVALPFMNFIVILLGIAITARAGRKGAAMLFGIGLGLMFAFWIISRFAIVFAQNGHLPPLVGAWLGNSIFLVIGLVLYRKAVR